MTESQYCAFDSDGSVAGPLAGVEVVEFAQLIAGPAAGYLLQSYGASVTKIEPPGGDGSIEIRSFAAAEKNRAPTYDAYNAGKASLRLDLRDERDVERAWRLIEDADVLIESGRPGVMDRLGFGVQVVLERFPTLVYASVSGFGWDEAAGKRPGVDLLAQAESGMMSITGFADGPPTKVGFTVIDSSTSHALCHGILAGLLRRNATGEGGVVRVSLLDVACNLVAAPMMDFLQSDAEPGRFGNDASLTAPAGVFRCLDGDLVLSAYLEPHWIRFAAAIGAEDLLDRDEYSTKALRVKNREQLTREIEARLRHLTRVECIALFEAANILCGVVKSVPEATRGAVDRDLIVLSEDDDYRVRNPIQMSAGESRSEGPA